MTQRYLWITDPHLLPHKRYAFLNHILDAKPNGVFLTGDISYSGYTCLGDLEFLGQRMKSKLYYVIGNHDVALSSFAEMKERLQELTNKYPNLVWMDRAGVVSLNEEVALVGASGFYTAEHGNRDFIKLTFDWFMIKEFRELSSWEERFAKFKQIAQEDTDIIIANLEKALETHSCCYVLTHFPPFKEADRHSSFLSEKFWEPYNSNTILGRALEKLVADKKKKRVIVLSGHTHSACILHLSRSLEVRVGAAGYFSKPTDNEIILV